MLCGFRFYRAALVVLVLTLLSLTFPQPAIARPNPAVTVHFKVTSVKRDQSISIRTSDFPLRTKFKVSMDVVAKSGTNGVAVGELDSGKGGEMEATYPIPAELQGKIILVLHFTSADGYSADGWFFNDTRVYSLPDPTGKPVMAFSEAKKGASVTVEAKNLPASTEFQVRVGPYYTFYNDYARTGSVTTQEDGSVKFNVELPQKSQSADYVLVRLDGGGTYVYNVYKNVDNGASVPESSLVKVVDCTLLYMNRIPALEPRADFDVVWTVQNTSLVDWDKHHVLFMYAGGTRMHKRDDKKTLPYDIERGKTFDFALDMIAPDQPGWYKTTWVVAQVANGNKTFCTLNVSVYVK